MTAKPKAMAPTSAAPACLDRDMQRIESLLKRLRWSLSPTATSSTKGQPRQPQIPPDEASAALGLQLGLAFGDAALSCASTWDDSTSAESIRSTGADRCGVEALRRVGCDIVAALSDAARSLSPSVSFGYCQGIMNAFGSSERTAKKALEIVLRWWSSWLAQCNAAISEALLRGFAGCTYRFVELTASAAQPATTNFLAEVYASLENDADRRCLVRECIDVAFGSMLCGCDSEEGSLVARRTITYLSEIVACCVLLPIGTSTIDLNRTLFWTAIVRECRLFVISAPRKYYEDAIAEILSWLTHILHLATLRSQRQSRQRDVDGNDEIFFMLLQLSDLVCHVLSTVGFTGDRGLVSAMGTVYNMILGNILCHFSGTSYSVSSIVSRLCRELGRVVRSDSTNAPALSDTTVFRIGLLALNAPDEKEVQRTLEALHIIIESGVCNDSRGSFVLFGTVRALGCIFASSATCNAVALKLQELADEYELNLAQYEGLGEVRALSELFVPTSGTRFASRDEQVCILLLASSLLNTNDKIRGTQSFSLLRRVVGKWSHLGVRALPLTIASLRASAVRGDSDIVFSAIDFLFTATAKDPTCAQSVWGIVSKCVGPSSPSVVRTTCIRMFVLLCKSNRRFYGRIRDSLGHFVASPDTETRIAAFATLCDLAKADLVRDVSEVVGWLQNGLRDDDGIIIHYSVMALHCFIQEGELDFSKVIKVLSKTLVEIDDIAAILLLPPIVIESLVVLLGDGYICENEDSDDEVDTNDDDDNSVSPQVHAAIGTLFGLAMSNEISPVVDESKDKGSIMTMNDADRILQSIYSSLSTYRIEQLGFDSDTIRSSVSHSGSALPEEKRHSGLEHNERYFSLQRIVLDGLEQRMQTACEDPAQDQKLMQLAWNLLAFEQDALGPSLWTKRGLTRALDAKEKKHAHKPSTRNLVMGALPDARILVSHWNENPCSATAIARMYCIEPPAKSSDHLMELLAEVTCDVKNDSSDPLFKALSFGAWLESMNSVWLSLVNFSSNSVHDAANKVVQELCEWKHSTDHHDSALIALGAFAFVIPDRYQGTDLSKVADEICNIVLEAHDGRAFADPDNAALALGFIGRRYARSTSLDLVKSIIGRLAAIASFNGFFGIGMIAQSLSTSLGSAHKADLLETAASTLIGTIASTLMSEFHSCLSYPLSPVLHLIACLKMGSSGPDLIKSMLEVAETDLIFAERKRLHVKGILISLAVTLPALSHSNSNLSAAACALIAKCPWGVGKGYALACAYKAKSDLPLEEEMRSIYSECIDAVTEAENGASYDDALFAAISFDQLLPRDKKRSNEIMSMIRRVLDGSNFTPDVRAAALFATCAHFGAVPLVSENFHLYGETKKSSLDTAVTDLSNIVTNPTENRRCIEMAVVVLGILCRMRFPRQRAVQASSKVSKKVDPHTRSSDLPQAQDSTLLQKLLDSIKNSSISGNDKKTNQRDSLLISCISQLPLPGDFSSLAEEVFNQANSDRGAMKAAFLRLLIAQIKSNRHSGSNRSEFIRLSIYLSKQTPAVFWSLFDSVGAEVSQFMAATSSFLYRWPSGVVDELLTNLWSICLFEITNRRSCECANALLFSLCATLQYDDTQDQASAKTSRRTTFNGSSITPVVQKSIRKVLIVEMFPSLVQSKPGIALTKTNELIAEGDREQDMQPNIWIAYFSCIENIPPSLLQEGDFFSVGRQCEQFDATIAKILCIAHLAASKQGDYFGGQRDREVLNANLWIARQKISSMTVDQLTAIRVCMFCLAKLRPDSNRTPTECQRDLILQSFEAMLVNGLDSLALEQLAVQCCYWCTCAVVGPSMSSLFTKLKVQRFASESITPRLVTSTISLFLQDLPSRLGFISTKLGLSGLVANRCLRLLQNVSHAVGCGGIPPNYALFDTAVNALKQIASCCSEVESNGMQYTNFIVSEMTMR